MICGAGASSTFVAGRLRRAALGEGVHLSVSAGAVASLGGEATAPSLVLVGAHLANDLESIREALPDTPVEVLPADIGRDLDGTRTLSIVTSALNVR